MTASKKSLQEKMQAYSHREIDKTGFRMAPSFEDIKSRDEKLNTACRLLKLEFAGLDTHIDQLMTSMRAWYLIPEAQTRPLVVGLWGMTGVGKTSLVTRLSQLLEIEQTFVQEDLGKYATQNTSSFLHNNEMMFLSGSPLMILLDEIHTMRTINEQGFDIDRPSARDFWTLLDTGLLSSFNESRKGLIISLRQQMKAMKESNPRYPLDDHYVQEIRRYLNLGTFDDDLKEIVHQQPEEFLAWCIQELEWAVKKNKPFDFRQALIFVAGNLDEVFLDAQNICADELTADELYERTKSISLDQIKRGLLQRFRPEQVARFGGNHLIFPSLSREAFYKMIRSHLKGASNRTRAFFNLDLNFDESIEKLVFQQGAIAAQGARLVLSMLNEIVDSRISIWVIEAMTQKLSHLFVSFDEKSCELRLQSIDKKTVHWREKLQLSEEKIPGVLMNANLRQIISTHEAAHAVVGIVNFRCLPVKSLTGPSAIHRGGWRVEFPQLPIVQTKSLLHLRLQVVLAGYAAERLCFGDDNITTGSVQDLASATELASFLTMQAGLGCHLGVSLPKSSPHNLTSLQEKDDLHKEEWLQNSLKKAEEILKFQAPLFHAIIEKMIEKEKMTSSDFAVLVKNYFNGSVQEKEQIIAAKTLSFFSAGSSTHKIIKAG